MRAVHEGRVERTAVDNARGRPPCVAVVALPNINRRSLFTVTTFTMNATPFNNETVAIPLFTGMHIVHHDNEKC